MKTLPRIAVMALSAAVLTGCASSQTGSPPVAADRTTSPSAETSVTSSAPPPTQPTPTTTKAPAAETKETAPTGKPEEVGLAFVEAAFTWDTRTDTHLTQALQKVDYLATEELAATFVTPQNTSGDADWNQAAEHQGYTVPTVNTLPGGNQAVMKSEPGKRQAAYLVSWTWAGTGGYKQTGARELVTLQLADINGQWLVSSFDLTYLTD